MMKTKTIWFLRHSIDLKVSNLVNLETQSKLSRYINSLQNPKSYFLYIMGYMMIKINPPRPHLIQVVCVPGDCGVHVLPGLVRAPRQRVHNAVSFTPCNNRSRSIQNIHLR